MVYNKNAVKKKTHDIKMTFSTTHNQHQDDTSCQGANEVI